RQSSVCNRKCEDLRPDPVLFSGKRGRETISSREDRLHPQTRVALRTCSYRSRREDEAESKRALAALYDSFSCSVASDAISGVAKPACGGRDFGPGTARCD